MTKYAALGGRIQVINPVSLFTGLWGRGRKKEVYKIFNAFY